MDKKNLLTSRKHYEKVKRDEQLQRNDIQHRHGAACIIQQAWRNWMLKKKTIPSSQKALQFQRRQVTQPEWEKEIAALTIQLAWRKFYRHKLLQKLHPNLQELKIWDPEIVALKQQAVITEIYNEDFPTPFWHPVLKPAVRPLWCFLIPSPAAVSYNFALNQYSPFKAWQSVCPSIPDFGSTRNPK